MLKSLNDITEAEYKEIEKLAGLFFSPDEIAEMLELDPVTFSVACKTQDNKCFNAFKGGRFQGEIDVRTGIVKMAKAGSTPAQTMAMDLIKKSLIKM